MISISRFRNFLEVRRKAIRNALAGAVMGISSALAVGYSAKGDNLQLELDKMKGQVESLALITAVEANVMEMSPYPMVRACKADDERAIVTVEDLGAVMLIPICTDSYTGQTVIPTPDLLRFKARYLARISGDQSIINGVSELTEGDNYCVPHDMPDDRVSSESYADSL